MSFRDNLQYLRASRNMTQEQLAMLLGVSRQSVTKWEAERSQPEMDKLLKMCQIFECSLDELVTADLPARARAAADEGASAASADAAEARRMPDGPPTDVCGFDDHQRMLARRVPSGVALCILGVAATALVGSDGMVLGSVPAERVGLGLLLAFLLAGLACFITAGMEHATFQRAHPYVEDFYTPEDRARAGRQLAYGVTGGIGLVFLGVMGPVLLEGTALEETVAAAWMLACVAAAAWLIVRYGMLYGRTDVAEYNKEAVEDLEVEDIMGAQLDEARREALLEQKRSSARVAAVCGAIMIVATIVALGLLFAPMAEAAARAGADGLSDVEWRDYANPFFWVPWPVGGMLCGIVTMLMEAFGKRG